jgi:hypothetical protein
MDSRSLTRRSFACHLAIAPALAGCLPLQLVGAPAASSLDLRVLRVRRIYSDGRHNAFTGLASFKGQLVCVFRSAQTHVSLDGVIRLIYSAPNGEWMPLSSSIEMPASDLRDPKVIAFQDRLLVYFAQRPVSQPEARVSMAAISPDGRSLQAPVKLTGILENAWLWHAAGFNGVLYGTAYRPTGTPRYTEAHLYRSTDGFAWTRLAAFPFPANEVYLDFDKDGTLWALARTDTPGFSGALCSATPPYESFQTFRALETRMQGPMLKRLPGGSLVACRRWSVPRRYTRTDLLWIPDGGEIQHLTTLPSGGDTSYAAWVDTGQGEAVMSYYSSHEHRMDDPIRKPASSPPAEHSTAADIYLASISYAT